MTTFKIKGKKNIQFSSGWIDVPIHMKAENINFAYHVVKVNNKTYTIWSHKFKKAFDDDRLFRLLKQ